jgi:hypothetical protein
MIYKKIKVVFLLLIITHLILDTPILQVLALDLWHALEAH